MTRRAFAEKPRKIGAGDTAAIQDPGGARSEFSRAVRHPQLIYINA